MRRKLLATLAIAAAVAGATAVAAYAAFSSTTSNSGDGFAAGTVLITDNDLGSQLFNLSTLKAADTATSCVNVSYSGTLDSTVRLYGSATGTIAPYITLTVTRGTDSSPSFPSCSNFTADATNYLGQGAGVIYTGALSSFPGSYAAGIVDPTSGSPATWSTSATHAYKVTIALADDTNDQGTTGSASLTWEARNS